MVAGEAILSCPNAIKPLVSAPYPAGGAAATLGVSAPPVGECSPLVGVPPSATTGTDSEDLPFRFQITITNKPTY